MNDYAMIVMLLALVYLTYAYVRRVESYDDPKLDWLKQVAGDLDIRAQNVSISGSNQSFTEDKHRIYLCLRREDGTYYDDNMLVYVLAHELAHYISKQNDPDHKTDEFKKNFAILLERAKSKGYWDPKLPLDYGYCPKTKAIAEANSYDGNRIVESRM